MSGTFKLNDNTKFEFLAVIPGSETIPNSNISDKCTYNLLHSRKFLLKMLNKQNFEKRLVWYIFQLTVCLP